METGIIEYERPRHCPMRGPMMDVEPYQLPDGLKSRVCLDCDACDDIEGYSFHNIRDRSVLYAIKDFCKSVKYR